MDASTQQRPHRQQTRRGTQEAKEATTGPTIDTGMRHSDTQWVPRGLGEAQRSERAHPRPPQEITKDTKGPSESHKGNPGDQEGPEGQQRRQPRKPGGASRSPKGDPGETKSSEWEPKGSQKIGPRGANRSLEVMQAYREGHTRATRDAQTENVRFPKGNIRVQRGT